MGQVKKKMAETAYGGRPQAQAHFRRHQALTMSDVAVR
jgi:hypothetical protein